MEDNREIEHMVEFLTSLVKKFRTIFPNHEYLRETRNVYDIYISPWMDKFLLPNREPDREYDERIKNRILETISELNKFLEKQQ
jgi:hypothetical protein